MALLAESPKSISCFFLTDVGKKFTLTAELKKLGRPNAPTVTVTEHKQEHARSMTRTKPAEADPVPNSFYRWRLGASFNSEI